MKAKLSGVVEERGERRGTTLDESLVVREERENSTWSIWRLATWASTGLALLPHFHQPISTVSPCTHALLSSLFCRSSRLIEASDLTTIPAHSRTPDRHYATAELRGTTLLLLAQQRGAVRSAVADPAVSPALIPSYPRSSNRLHCRLLEIQPLLLLLLLLLLPLQLLLLLLLLLVGKRGVSKHVWREY